MTESEKEQDGQVSEVSSLGEPGEEIAPDQAVQGAPDAESGEVQEGTAGPNARQDDNSRHEDE